MTTELQPLPASAPSAPDGEMVMGSHVRRSQRRASTTYHDCPRGS
jgi:hypothetical protein